ncbi:MAG TPA: patatin family protein [Myxococcota bacterium]|nr:patatin family protein [Myxococcota bacterium]HRY94735.1 patatin family protein [Myxococcota bacterium]HSA20042.1 patatin family protein [Myxococcota bacterium]
MAPDRTALIVEGGGMRGVFPAGVLDAWLEAGHDPFDLYLGVSAGAADLSSHLAGQRGRNVRVYTGLMCLPWFFNLPGYLRGGHYMDLDWFWEAFERLDPLHYAAAASYCRERGKTMLMVATSVETGQPVYFEPDARSWSAMLKASCALPLLYRGGVEIQGRVYVDGGVTDALPVAEALRRGATRVVVIRTRPSDYVKEDGLEQRVLALVFRGNPALRVAILRKVEAYTASVELIHHPPAGVEIVEIAPPAPLRASRTCHDAEALLADYRLGHDLGRAHLACPGS